MPVTPGYYRDMAVLGNSFMRQYQCKSGDLPVDLTGHTVKWRGVYGDVVIEKTTANGSLVMSTPTNGTVLLSLTPEETRLVPVNDNMKYELELMVPGVSQQTVLWGDLVGQGGATSD